MKVKLLSVIAGPDIHHDAGAILDLPAKEARELIDGGNAVEYEEPKESEQPEREPRTPIDEQAGEFGRRSVRPQTTTAKHPHAEETVKVEHKAHNK
jgi:hypothetical protein